jgi:O-antigen/teichoic acid export membrane protein
MAYEKMDYYAIISLIEVTLKLLIVCALPFLPFDKLVTYSFLYLIISILDFALYFLYCKRKFIGIKYKSGIPINKYKEILLFSGWNLLGTFAFVIKGQGINLMLNSFFGPIVNAARAIAFQVSGAIMGFQGNIATAFRPQLVNSYAEGNQERAISLVFTESKACFILMALLVVPLSLEIDYALKLWLGETIPQYSNIFVILTLADLLINTLNTPITQIIFATGKLKKYQIGSSICNLLIFIPLLIVLKSGGSSIYAFVLTIIFSVINQCVCVYYAEKETRFGILRYLHKVIIPCSLYILLLPIPLYFIHSLMAQGVIRILILGSASAVISIVLCMLIVLQKAERQYIYNTIKSRFNG